jgi:peptide/nickel transport system permease protein
MLAKHFDRAGARVGRRGRATSNGGRPVRRDLLGLLGFAVLSVLVAVATFADWLPLGDPYKVNAGRRLGSPSAHFIAGTDALGRSELPRLARALQATFLLAGGAVIATAILGVVLAVVAAYFGGLIGELITRGADVLFAFPAILLAILIVAITGPGKTGAIISIVLICTPLMVRVVRAAALSVVDRDFVVAARVGGTSSLRILTVHVLPNIAGTAIVQATYALSLSMLIESGLSFLGLGVQAPDASLGSLVQESAVYLSIAPWLVLIPGVVLALAITSVNLAGDALRDRLDVRATEVRR